MTRPPIRKRPIVAALEKGQGESPLGSNNPPKRRDIPMWHEGNHGTVGAIGQRISYPSVVCRAVTILGRSQRFQVLSLSS